jgi:hypothetical protein
VAPPVAFPTVALADLEGRSRPLEETWRQDRALVLVGHGDCHTTRLVLPYLDRIHRRRGKDATVVLVLQDDPDAARALVSELSLDAPVRLEPDPYPLARALDLVAVPSLYLVERGGKIDRTSIGFRRSDLEGFAAGLGVPGPLFTPEDRAPDFRPG